MNVVKGDLGVAINCVGANCPQREQRGRDLKGETGVIIDPCFPNVGGADELADAQTGMARITDETADLTSAFCWMGGGSPFQGWVFNG